MLGLQSQAAALTADVVKVRRSLVSRGVIGVSVVACSLLAAPPGSASSASASIAMAVVPGRAVVPGTADHASPSPTRATDLLSLAELLPNPTIIHPDIAAQVDVDLSGLSRMATELSAAHNAELDAATQAEQGEARQARLEAVRRDTIVELDQATTETNAANRALERAKVDLGSFALGTFVNSSALELESFSTDTGPSPIPTLAAGAESVLVTAQREATSRLDQAVLERQRTSDNLDATEAELVEVAAAIVDAEQHRDVASDEISRLEPLFEAALRTAPVVGTDFPVVVLDAYYRAALRTAEEKPWCGVRWDQLAGIGKVESRHGTYGGNTVGPDGRTDGEILGPVLDGTRFASIPDTDGGRYDLDPVWDRAVGPMQFIPGSWVRFGADGNSDGEIDPHNMYDAAMAAANHLCGSTGGLGDDANYQRALLGYNRSVPYGLMVMDFAKGYRNAVGLAPTASSVADPVVDPAVTR